MEQHADNTLGWKPIGIENSDWIRIQSTECTTYLTTPEEVNQRACVKCQKVTQLASFRKCVDCATGNAPAHMPYKYLTAYQMRQLLVTTRKQNDAMKFKVPLKFLISHRIILMIYPDLEPQPKTWTHGAKG